MLQLDKLRELSGAEHTGVTSVKKQVHLALEPSFLANINSGIIKHLGKHLHEYYPQVSAILLGFENIKLKRTTGSLYSDQPYIHIDFQATFYIFCPTPGTFLLGTINQKSEGHVGCLVHDSFNASILCSPEDSIKTWAGAKLTHRQVIKFRVVSASQGKDRLVMLGEFDKASMDVAESDVVVGMIQQVNHLDGDSEHDSGIENGHKRKIKEVTVETDAANARVTSAPSGATGSKRKAEEEAEEVETERKRKKKEKKAKKEKERLEKEKLVKETSNSVDSSEEFQSESKLKKKKEKKEKENKLEDTNFSNILEPDLLSPKTPNKPKDKSSTVPKTPKTPKDDFVLPSDFKVLEHKTEKSNWKSYQGPDGKNYRSITEVKKFIESKTSNFNPENLAATIDFVVTEWNSTEEGCLQKNKSKFYASEFAKEFPKTELYFANIKPKQTPKNTMNESSVQSKSEKTTNDESKSSAKLEESGNKLKKRKNKKNKSKDTSLE